MSDKTGIEWTDATWNPTKGCDRVSPGCDHCYAMTLAPRLKAMGSPAYQLDGDPRTSGPGFLAHEWPDALDQPLRWTKPRRIFVNSMSDLFHDNISDEFLVKVFDVMATARQHTFQVLTKRHARMRSFVTKYVEGGFATHPTAKLAGVAPNVWLGVSVENQQWADIRIPALLDTPAAVRFLSCEPLLGPIDLRQSINVDPLGAYHFRPGGIDWVIVGGESGPGARPMHHAWASSLRAQCQASDVAFLFKQWGSWGPAGTWQGPDHHVDIDGTLYQPGENFPDLLNVAAIHNWGKKAAGRILDGRTWDQYPVGAA